MSGHVEMLDIKTLDGSESDITAVHYVHGQVTVVPHSSRRRLTITQTDRLPPVNPRASADDAAPRPDDGIPVRHPVRLARRAPLHKHLPRATGREVIARPGQASRDGHPPPGGVVTESEARAIQSMSVDELEAEMLPANREATAHAGCGEHAACRIRSSAVVDTLLDEWVRRTTKSSSREGLPQP